MRDKEREGGERGRVLYFSVSGKWIVFLHTYLYTTVTSMVDIGDDLHLTPSSPVVSLVCVFSSIVAQCLI